MPPTVWRKLDLKFGRERCFGWVFYGTVGIKVLFLRGISNDTYLANYLPK